MYVVMQKTTLNYHMSQEINASEIIVQKQEIKKSLLLFGVLHAEVMEADVCVF